jgi:hypothetical protein
VRTGPELSKANARCRGHEVSMKRRFVSMKRKAHNPTHVHNTHTLTQEVNRPLSCHACTSNTSGSSNMPHSLCLESKSSNRPVSIRRVVLRKLCLFLLYYTCQNFAFPALNVKLVDWHKNKTVLEIKTVRFGSSVGTLGIHVQLSATEPGDGVIVCKSARLNQFS